MIAFSVENGNDQVLIHQESHVPSGGKMLNLFKQSIKKLANRTIGRFSRGRGCMLCLHRVVPEEEKSTLSLPRDLEVSTKFLTNFIEHFQGLGYSFIALDDLSDFLRSSDSGPVMVLTFDDGYKDNLDFALPICEAARIPMAVYVTSGMIDRTLDPWWYSLQSLILERDCVFTGNSGEGEVLRSVTHDEKEEAYRWIYKKIHVAEEGKQEVLERLWKSNDLNGPSGNGDLVMTWDDLRQLNESPLVTIGAHTVTHPRLIGCDSDEIRKEFVESNARINQELGIEPIHLAYPFGSENDIPVGISDIVSSVGYETGVTTIPRTLERGDEDLLFTLPRKFISDAIDDLTDQEWRIGGMSVLFDPNRRQRLRSASGFK